MRARLTSGDGVLLGHDITQQVDCDDDLGRCQRVVDTLAVLPGADQALVTQHSKVLRRIRLRDIELFAHVRHASLTVSKRIDEEEALGIAEALAYVGVETKHLLFAGSHVAIMPHTGQEA